MVKKDEYALDVKFADLKDLFKEGKGDTKEFDELSREMLDYMGELTIKGIKGDFIIEKISLEGKNVICVPVSLDFPKIFRGAFASPFRNSMKCFLPSLLISNCKDSDNAFTTDTPTP